MYSCIHAQYKNVCVNIYFFNMDYVCKYDFTCACMYLLTALSSPEGIHAIYNILPCVKIQPINMYWQLTIKT